MHNLNSIWSMKAYCIANRKTSNLVLYKNFITTHTCYLLGYRCMYRLVGTWRVISFETMFILYLRVWNNISCLTIFRVIFQVLWYRDTLQLDMTEWRITDVRGNRYTLRLRKVQKTDFGNYSCVADNGLGKSKRSIEVTGKYNS
jgi:hypothetical protein